MRWSPHGAARHRHRYRRRDRHRAARHGPSPPRRAGAPAPGRGSWGTPPRSAGRCGRLRPPRRSRPASRGSSAGSPGRRTDRTEQRRHGYTDPMSRTADRSRTKRLLPVMERKSALCGAAGPGRALPACTSTPDAGADACARLRVHELRGKEGGGSSRTGAGNAAAGPRARPPASLDSPLPRASPARQRRQRQAGGVQGRAARAHARAAAAGLSGSTGVPPVRVGEGR